MSWVGLAGLVDAPAQSRAHLLISFENVNPIPTHKLNQSEPWITKPNSCWVKGSCLEMPVTNAKKQILPSISLYTGNKLKFFDLIKILHLVEFIGMILYSDLLHENPNDQDKQTSSSDCNMKCNLPYRENQLIYCMENESH